MPTTKVTQDYQVTIPSGVREKAGIKVGDIVAVEYDEHGGVIKIQPPWRGKRKTTRLGRKLTVREIEASIEKGMFGTMKKTDTKNLRDHKNPT